MQRRVNEVLCVPVSRAPLGSNSFADFSYQTLQPVSPHLVSCRIAVPCRVSSRLVSPCLVSSRLGIKHHLAIATQCFAVQSETTIAQLKLTHVNTTATPSSSPVLRNPFDPLSTACTTVIVKSLNENFFFYIKPALSRLATLFFILAADCESATRNHGFDLADAIDKMYSSNGYSSTWYIDRLIKKVFGFYAHCSLHNASWSIR